MKKIMMIAVLMAANVVYGQWLPVSVNTNTGVFKPVNIGTDVSAGLTNAYSTSGTVDRAYVSGKSVVVQFNTNAALPYVFSNTNIAAGIVTQIGSIVLIGTNPVPFVTPPWYRPATNYNGSLLWYSFDTENPAYIVDVTSNGNNGYSIAPVGATVFTNYAARISSAYENSISTDATNLMDGGSELTLAMWLYFSSPVSQTAEFVGSGIVSNAATPSVSLRNSSTHMLFRLINASDPAFSSSVLWTYGAALTTGSWHRLVATYKKNGPYGTSTANLSIYFDGQFKTNTTVAQNAFIPVRSPWVWGTYSCKLSTPASSVWDGYIDDCIIAPTAWTLGQVTNDFNAGRTLAP